MASPTSIDPPEALPPAESGADENAPSFFRSDGKNLDLSQSRMTEPLPLSYMTAQEMRCVLHWLSIWTPAQRECFLRDLVDKAVPWKLFPLMESLSRLRLEYGKPPSIYKCQMRLWNQWFRSWSEAERNEFVRQMEEEMPDLAGRFYQEVAALAQQD
ncbi:uncharacterized protein C14orf119 homolog [Pseudonaja textilis]|uniref:Chromosome 14 open reading frame 119 n=1 Tax=Pseudonaja textilis TaxID=8673 RepID=A0A670YRC8_PSETE|nr:uncharacterized protein C14orf119 homolog [Pseudonaja textilis]